MNGMIVENVDHPLPALAAPAAYDTVQLTITATGATITARPVPLPPLDVPHAYMIYVDDTPDGISNELRSESYVLPEGFGLLPELTSPGGRVLDLGAHIGTFSLTAAALGYQVLAVEASPYNAALLCQSVTANQFAARVQVAPRAVGDREGEVEFVAAGPHGFIANDKVQAPTVKVPLTTVQHILTDVGWDWVDFIKLDVEGSEPAVLRGLADLLSRPDAPPILIEVNGHTLDFFDETPQTLLTQLEALGYRCYLVQWGKLLIPARATDWQPEVLADYLAIKRPLPPLRAWTIAPSSSPEVLRRRFVASAGADHPHIRQHVGRTLAQAPIELLGHPDMIAALDRLAADPDAAVRATVGWWDEGDGPTVRAQAVQQSLHTQAEARAETTEAPTSWQKWWARFES